MEDICPKLQSSQGHRTSTLILRHKIFVICVQYLYFLYYLLQIGSPSPTYTLPMMNTQILNILKI